jgi:mannose-6-phosphate isomerase-like protein (cupin superfamily)
MELKKIHEDERGYIYLLEDMLKDGKEVTFLELKKGYARGGCMHSNDEYMVVIKGKITLVLGNNEEELVAGDSKLLPKGIGHSFIGIDDSIVCEWGITSEEKDSRNRDLKMRQRVEEINQKQKNSSNN